MHHTHSHLRSPFKFLDPYERNDGRIFFGRDEEVEQLYQFANKNRLVLVYGQSGTGKTSLVQCGLANRFEVTDWMPFFIRRGKDINASLLQAIAQSKALGGAEVKASNLLASLERISARYVRPIYLIFDQFEELLILGEKEERAQFVATIKELLAAEETQSVNLLFVLREEYFAWLDDFERVIPHFSSRRLRVEPMRPNRLEEVILESCASFKISLEAGRDNARQIIENLRSKGGIPLPYLQVYLDMLWREDYLRTYPNGWQGKGPAPLAFTTQEIEAFGVIKDVLDRFLSERTEALQKELEAVFPGLEEETVSRVLDAFATEEGTKRPVNYEQEEELVRIADNAPAFLKQLPPAPLTACLRALEQSRILRADDDTFELAHDTLAALVDQKRTDEQRRLNRLRRLVSSNFEVHQYLTIGHLAEIGADLDKLSLEPAQLNFVEESRLEASARERKRRRRNLIIGSVLAAAAVVSIFFAIRANDKTNQANDALAQTELAREEAEQKRLEADQAKNQALGERERADQKAKEAEQSAEEARTEKDRANQALNNLNTTRKQVVEVLIEQTEELILALDYEAALAKLNTAGSLVARDLPLGRTFMEMAFFYGETYRFEEAGKTFEQASALFGRSGLKAPVLKGTDTIAYLKGQRSALAQLDQAHFEELQAKYYPDMVTVTGGTFTMGCLEGRDGNCEDREKPSHEVKVSDFEMARTETTVWQYNLFCEASKKDNIQRTKQSWGLVGDNPVVDVSWYDALKYANWLSDRQDYQEVVEIDGPNASPKWEANGYRLPTEAEWEYAARGGQKSEGYPYSGSESIDSVAWYSSNAQGRTQSVRQKKANELGLFHMSGNVWEWCWDWYGYYSQESQINPKGPDSGSRRVNRGGSWYVSATGARVADRYSGIPGLRSYDIGFRLARAVR